MTAAGKVERDYDQHPFEFSEGVWIIDGPTVRDMGARFPTRMTITRLSDRSLWVSSPVPLPPNVINEIDSLGKIKYLVAGTPRHLWRLTSWHTLYPSAQLWVSPQAAGKHKKFAVVGDSDLKFTGILSDDPPKDWRDDFEQVVFQGSNLIQEMIFYHKRSHTLIMDDLIQNYPKIKGRPLHNGLVRILGVSYPDGGVPFDIRMSFRNRDLARKALEKVLSWDFNKLVLAHGVCVEKEAKDFFRRAFRWLTD